MQCIVSDTAGLRDYPSVSTGTEGMADNGQSVDQRNLFGVIDEVELEGMRRARETFNNAHIRYLYQSH